MNGRHRSRTGSVMSKKVRPEKKRPIFLDQIGAKPGTPAPRSGKYQEIKEKRSPDPMVGKKRGVAPAGSSQPPSAPVKIVRKGGHTVRERELGERGNRGEPKDVYASFQPVKSTRTVPAATNPGTVGHGRSAIADMDWYISNLRLLVQKYPDHWLAIFNQEVVAAAPDTRQLQQRLDEMGIARAFIGRSHPDAVSGSR